MNAEIEVKEKESRIDGEGREGSMREGEGLYSEREEKKTLPW